MVIRMSNNNNTSDKCASPLNKNYNEGQSIPVNLVLETVDGVDTASIVGGLPIISNGIGDWYKERNDPDLLVSGVYGPEAVENSELRNWRDRYNNDVNREREIRDPNIRSMNWFDDLVIWLSIKQKLPDREL